MLLAVAGSAAADDIARGKALFTGEASPPCGLCHTLADAGTEGAIGPVLDDLKPDAARVAATVTQGVGVMPAYAEILPASDIAALAAYVSSATGAQ
nr:cytochrome c [Acuticoccus mangrovi]